MRNEFPTDSDIRASASASTCGLTPKRSLIVGNGEAGCSYDGPSLHERFHTSRMDWSNYTVGIAVPPSGCSQRRPRSSNPFVYHSVVDHEIQAGTFDPHLRGHYNQLFSCPAGFGLLIRLLGQYLIGRRFANRELAGRHSSAALTKVFSRIDSINERARGNCKPLSATGSSSRSTIRRRRTTQLPANFRS